MRGVGKPWIQCDGLGVSRASVARGLGLGDDRVAGQQAAASKRSERDPEDWLHSQSLSISCQPDSLIP